MTDGHEHTWEPMPLRTGRYCCACGEQAYRARGGLRIARNRHRDQEPSVRNRMTYDGAVPMLPRLDQTERW